MTYTIKDKRDFKNLIRLVIVDNQSNKNAEKIFEFEQNEYVFEQNDCENIYCRVSNHGNNNLNVCFCMDECENITIDGRGSFFRFKDGITPFLMRCGKNITLKNFKIYVENTNVISGKVIYSSNERVDVKIPEKYEVFLKGNGLFLHSNGKEYELKYSFSALKGRISEKDSGQCFDAPFELLLKSLNGQVLSIPNPPKTVDVNSDIVLISTGSREGSGIIIDRCQNIRIENVTIYHCVGMGVIAQKSKDISIDRMKVMRYGDGAFSLNADAVHFVNCRGKINVTNSLFESQLDDACNIHGIYTKIVEVDKNRIKVQFMQKETLDIPIYQIGDKLEICKNDTLKPYFDAEIQDVVYNNDGTADVILDKTPSIVHGNSLAEVASDKVLFTLKNCIIRDNRTRGILLAAKGSLLVEGNYFNTHNSAILFEANANFWFESGGVDVAEIKNNFFCGTDSRAESVIKVCKRDKQTDDFCFNKHIDISNNLFDKDCYNILECNNTREFIFSDNITYGNKRLTISNTENVLLDGKEWNYES